MRIASSTLSGSLEKKVEFLPVTIQGYAETYFILNTLDHVSCLLKRLVLRDDSVPSSRALFQVGTPDRRPDREGRSEQTIVIGLMAYR